MLEFATLAHGLFRPDQLVVHYDPTLCIHPDQQERAWMDNLWQEKLRQAQQQQRRLFDAPLFRLVDAIVRPALSANLRTHWVVAPHDPLQPISPIPASPPNTALHITLGDTSYKEYVTTRTLEFSRNHARSELGNALGVCSVVETSDNYILLDKREGVDVYVGRYHVIGGFFERDLDISNPSTTNPGSSHPDPFAAITREIREETGIRAGDISEQYCLGAVYDLTTPHGELLFLTRLHIPLAAVQQRTPEDNEIKRLHPLKVTSASLQTFIQQHHGNISATGEPNLLFYGAWKFGLPWLSAILPHL